MEEIYQTVDLIMLSQKKARARHDYITLMENGLALLERMPKLIEYSTEKEHEYRVFEARLTDERDDTGKKLTGSYCETQAKATEAYKEWRKAEKFMDLMYEQVQISKKLAGSVDKELSASHNN